MRAIGWTVTAAGLLAAAVLSSAGSSMRGLTALVARTDRLDITHIPVAMNGRFRIGALSGGSVHRVALASWTAAGDDRTAWQRRYGTVTFDAAGSAVGGALAARCGYDRAALETRFRRVAIAEVARPLGYGCDFTLDGRPAGHLDLEAAPPLPGAPLTGPRTGTIRFGDTMLRLRSIHHMERARWPVAEPLGYEMIGADGVAVGAIDLTGATKARLALPHDPVLRAATLAAGLSLALFWDPADLD